MGSGEGKEREGVIPSSDTDPKPWDLISTCFSLYSDSSIGCGDSSGSFGRVKVSYFLLRIGTWLKGEGNRLKIAIISCPLKKIAILLSDNLSLNIIDSDT